MLFQAIHRKIKYKNSTEQNVYPGLALTGLSNKRKEHLHTTESYYPHYADRGPLKTAYESHPAYYGSMDSSSKPSAKKNGNQRVLQLKTGYLFYVKSVKKELRSAEINVPNCV